MDRRQTFLFPWICLLIVCSYNLMQSGLSSFASVVHHDIQTTLNINSVQMGWLSSAFLYTYMMMQIPVGLLFDRFSAEKLLSIATFFLLCGTLILANTNHFTVALIARALMGLGTSFSLIGLTYLIRGWFPSIFVIVLGVTQIFLVLGQICFSMLFVNLSQIMHWQTILYGTAFVLVIVLFGLYFYVRESNAVAKEKIYFSWQALREVLKNSTFLKLMICYTLGSVYYGIMVNLWQVSRLETAYHIPLETANDINLFVTLGYGVGAFSIGILTRYISRQWLLLMGLLLQFIFILITTFFLLPPIFLSICMFCIGLTGGVVILPLDLVRNVVPKTLYGLAVGIMNMFYCIICIILLPLTGYIFESVQIKVYLSPLVIAGCSLIAVISALLLLRKKIEVKE
jgi:MFS family permease